MRVRFRARSAFRIPIGGIVAPPESPRTTVEPTGSRVCLLPVNQTEGGTTNRIGARSGRLSLALTRPLSALFLRSARSKLGQEVEGSGKMGAGGRLRQLVASNFFRQMCGAGELNFCEVGSSF